MGEFRSFCSSGGCVEVSKVVPASNADNTGDYDVAVTVNRSVETTDGLQPPYAAKYTINRRDWRQRNLEADQAGPDVTARLAIGRTMLSGANVVLHDGTDVEVPDPDQHFDAAHLTAFSHALGVALMEEVSRKDDTHIIDSRPFYPEAV